MNRIANHAGRRRAFSLIELLVVILIIVLLIALTLPGLGSFRNAGRRTICMTNMRQFGAAHAGYAQDYKGYIATFNGNPDRPESAVDCAAQARDIINTRLGGSNGPLNTFFQSGGTVPHHWFSHLMLVEYLGGNVPMAAAVCPSDRARLDWSARAGDPANMQKTPFRPRKQANSANLAWWPYSSSYQLMPAAWGADIGRMINCTQGAVCQQTTDHDTYYDHECGQDKCVWGKRRIEQVSFPSQKVAVADEQQRHYGTEMYYAYERARQPLLFWDSSVSIRRTADARRGWNPAVPQDSQSSEVFFYRPDLGFESPTLNGQPMESVRGYYKWTRGGLAGVDYGGSEIDTSRW